MGDGNNLLHGQATKAHASDIACAASEVGNDGGCKRMSGMGQRSVANGDICLRVIAKGHQTALVP
jgi:hypothetical protein